MGFNDGDGGDSIQKRKGPRVKKAFTPIELKRLERPGLHAVGGVPGLLLQISATGAKSWIYRYRFENKRRHQGLGNYPGISLAGARELASESYKQVIRGIDPLAQKAQLKATVITFDEASKRFIEDRRDGWRNPKHRQQWENTLATYASPFIGKMNVASITRAHVLTVLEQPVEGSEGKQKLWHTKQETASRLRGRIKLVLDWCTGRDYRTGPNPAEWAGCLDSVLPSAKALAAKNPVRHHPAVQIDQIPALTTALAGVKGVAAQIAQLQLLTAVRGGEARGATWGEFDMENKLWTVPAGRTKTNTEHRVPLSTQAVELLESLPRFKDCEFVFPGAKGVPLSDMATLKVFKALGFKDKDGHIAVPHGLRSSFRDWVSEATDFDGFLAEVALGHVVGDKVEKAYRRGDALARRRELMQAWADYCTGQAIQNNTNQG